MQGIITGRDVFTHPYMVAHEYGGRVFLRCVLAVVCRRKVTFLALAWGRG